MDYLIVIDGIISNIIVCESDDIAFALGAVPFYKGACIGGTYTPPESTPTLDERVTNLEGDTEELHEALNMILTGVTE